jgi:hypothetical protein
MLFFAEINENFFVDGMNEKNQKFYNDGIQAVEM